MSIILFCVPVRNDIAILRLDDGLYGNGYIEFAPLPYPGETLPNKFTCYITGWGLLYSKYSALKYSHKSYEVKHESY